MNNSDFLGIHQKSPNQYKQLIISNYIDFLRFYFPVFCIRWLMGDDLLSANSFGNAHHFRADTVGFQSAAQVGRCVGEMDDKVSDGAFLWCHVVLRRFLRTAVV